MYAIYICKQHDVADCATACLIMVCLHYEFATGKLKGQKLALVGVSGSGKTTIAKLLLKYHILKILTRVNIDNQSRKVKRKNEGGFKIMKKTKRIMVLCMVCVLLLGTATSVSAKTLAQSFSGGTSMICIDTHVIKGCKWRKTAWAQTKGYYNKRHYVRAYIGGSSSSASGAWADTGRQYSNGNIYRACSSSQWDYGKSTIGLFPRGYAKYGH